MGIFIGGEIEDMRVEHLYSQMQDQNLDYQNIVTERNYLEFLIDRAGDAQGESEGRICERVKGSYYTSIENLDQARVELEDYIDNALVNEEEFYRLEAHYTNLQIDYWMLAQRIVDICGYEGNFFPILYFYESDDECPSCEDQGMYLDYVKNKLDEKALIFSINAERQEGPTVLLMQQYRIFEQEAPTLVIDDELYGFKTSDEVLDILCQLGLEEDYCN